MGNIYLPFIRSHANFRTIADGDYNDCHIWEVEGPDGIWYSLPDTLQPYYPSRGNIITVNHDVDLTQDEYCLTLIVGTGSIIYHGFTLNQGEIIIGDIYNKITWLNLNDFDLSGPGGKFSVVSNKIVIGDDSGAFNNFLKLKHVSCLDDWHWAIEWIQGPNTITPFLLKTFSVNTGVQAEVDAYPTGTDDANPGQGAIRYFINGGYIENSQSNPSIIPRVNGNAYGMEFSWNDREGHRLRIYEIPANAEINLLRTIEYTDPVDGFSQNTFRPAVQSGSGATITKLRYWSNSPRGGKWVMGDSLTFGAYAATEVISNEADRFTRKIGARVYAGSGDKTDEGILRLPELITYVQPELVGIMLGTNDGDDTNYELHLTAITDALDTAGIDYVVFTVTPRNDVDLSNRAQIAIDNYPGKCIDLYSAFLDGVHNIKPEYDSGDGLHWNTAGNAAAAALILASGLW